MPSLDQETDSLSLPPGKWDEEVLYLMEFDSRLNDTIDLRKPHLRHTFATFYPLIIFIYAILVATGVVANCVMICGIFRDGLYKDQTFCYFINLALCNLVMCVVVLPLSLTVILIQNWIFGSFMCYFLPMIQDIPIHTSMLTFVLIAYDRYRHLKHPSTNRMPAFVMATASWLSALCIVLPYPIYTTYIDLGAYGKDHLEGVGFCAFNLADDMRDYVRGSFVFMYLAPLCLIAYLFVQISRELERRLAQVISNTSLSRVNSTLNPPTGRYGQEHRRGRSPTVNFGNNAVELDLIKERKIQKYLTNTIIVSSVFLSPLMVLRLFQMFVPETYENTGHFDYIYIVVVWLGFLNTCTTPLIFIYWRMNKSEKERILEYFRLRTNPNERSDGELAFEEDQQETTLDQSRGQSHSARTSEGAISTTPVINNCRHPLLARNERMV